MSAFQTPHEMRGQSAVQKPSQNGKKKDAHPVLTGLFPIVPALVNGAILTSVTLK